MTLFISEFSCLASKILRIIHIELVGISYLRHLSTYKLINSSSGLTIS